MGKSIVVNKLDEFYDNHDKIQIPIMFYVDDSGNKVYDWEEMTNEFENVCSNLNISYRNLRNK